jgi:hypothetical protein
MTNHESVLLLGLVVFGVAACSSSKVYITDSRPVRQAIIVDGRSNDWVGALSVISDGRAEEGFLNDPNSLYVCFVTEDESFRRQIASGGLTIWFDPRGGDQKVLGIKYPLGMRRREHPSSPNAESDQPSEGPSESDTSTVEVFSSGSGAFRRLKISDAEGLEIASATTDGLFVYELKIPLGAAPDYPVAIGAAPGDKVGVGIEVAKSEHSPSPGRRSEGMSGRGGGGSMGGGGMYGGGRGHMRGGGGMGGDMGGRGPERETLAGLKVWTYIRLSGAKNPERAQSVK